MNHDLLADEGYAQKVDALGGSFRARNGVPLHCADRAPKELAKIGAHKKKPA